LLVDTTETEGLQCSGSQLWHLLPCLHIPTYRADFSAGRDRHDPEFLALVLAVQSTVFIAVPRKWLPPGLTSGLRQLTERCVAKSEELLEHGEDVSITGDPRLARAFPADSCFTASLNQITVNSGESRRFDVLPRTPGR
jgi:hypothetical protein